MFFSENHDNHHPWFIGTLEKTLPDHLLTGAKVPRDDGVIVDNYAGDN